MYEYIKHASSIPTPYYFILPISICSRETLELMFQEYDVELDIPPIWE
jgi:hypothetical protein